MRDIDKMRIQLMYENCGCEYDDYNPWVDPYEELGWGDAFTPDNEASSGELFAPSAPDEDIPF